MFCNTIKSEYLLLFLYFLALYCIFYSIVISNIRNRTVIKTNMIVSINEKHRNQIFLKHFVSLNLFFIVCKLKMIFKSYKSYYNKHF